MKIILTGSLGNISKPLAISLIKAGHQVKIISSKAERASEIKAIGAEPLIGSLEDEAFLNAAFAGSELVYTMIPPNFAAPNVRKFMNDTTKNYIAAIKKSGVKKVLNLSSIGAHLSEGTGPIKGLHDGEIMLNGLADVSVKHLRPSFFYTNFFGNIDMVKHMGILGSNYAGNIPLLLVHPDDIAAAAFEEIQNSFSGKSFRYVYSDERKADEIASVLGASVGKPDLKWLEFTDEQALGGMIQGALPEEMAKNYVEMGTAVRSGKLLEDFHRNRPASAGKVKLEAFAKEFAAAF